MAKVCSKLIIDEDILQVTRGSLKKHQPSCKKLVEIFKICDQKEIKIIADDKFWQVYVPHLMDENPKIGKKYVE